MTLDAQRQLRVNCQPRKSGPHCVSTSKILWLFTRTTLTKILLNWNTVMHHLQFYLERSISSWLVLDFTSTWLYPEIFRHQIRNSDSLALKHSELLVSHQGSLRSEEHIYPYLIRATLDSRVLQKWSCSVKYTLRNYPYAIPMSPHTLV